MKLVFSQNSIFHLYRLGLVVTSKTGKKYRLSDEEEMKSLIRYCNRSDNTTVCNQYDNFLYSLDAEVLTEIENLTGSFFEEGDEFKGLKGGIIKLDYDTVEHPPLHPRCRCTVVPVLK